MAPKVFVPKALKPVDKVKNGSILDVQGFLAFYNNSKDAKKVVKAFEESRILQFLTFNYKSVYKEEVLEFHLNARMGEGKRITSRVAGQDVEICADSIYEAFEFPQATEANIRSHVYNVKNF